MIDRSLNYGREAVRVFAQEVAPIGVALDLGAGTGADLRSVRTVSPSAQLHAIEFHPPNVRVLSENGVHVHQADLERDRLPLADESVDLVIANQVLEHVKEVFWVLHEVSRTLRVGGTFILGLPNLASLHNRFLLLVGRQPSVIQNDSAHVRGFTRRDVLALLRAGAGDGYRLERVRGTNFYPFPPAVARPLAQLFPSLAWGLFLRLTKVSHYDGGFLRHPVEQGLETNFWLGPTASDSQGAA